MKKPWFRQLLRRRFFIALLLALQAYVLFRLIADSSRAAAWLDAALRLVSLLAALRVISTRDKPTYKLLWVFLILLFPVFGGLLYLLVSCQASTRWVNRRLTALEQTSRPLLAGRALPPEAACAHAPGCAPQLRYLYGAGFPAYGHTQCRYYSPGEALFPRLLAELEKAERYIFLEFFIVEQGVLWDAVLDILRRKAAQGVTVRLLYDDVGSFLTLPRDFPAQLERLGIDCRKFNPFRPVLSSIQNNRDHRKILSVDGRLAMTGGVNLADEYINAVEKHGYWKDCGLVLEGDAAWGLTVMFLQMWNLACRTDEPFDPYRPAADAPRPPSDGLVLPYADSPVDRENVGEHVYLQIIQNAKQYVYISTPYLIVDDSMVSALALAAKSGVDVRIAVPHHWDKWIVHMTTRAYYRPLVEAGVRVYEYTPGFLHSKTFVSDDCTATVGTTNLDYRSLYLHFECGVWLHGSRAAAQVRDDFLAMLPLCREIAPADCRAAAPRRLFQELLRLVAPLF